MPDNVAFYRPFADLANRLVNQFGASAVLIRSEQVISGDEEERPWEGNLPPTHEIVAYPCVVLIGAYNGVELANDQIEVANAKIMLVREGLQIEPSVNDMIQLTNEDRAFQIESIRPIMPGGYPIYWEIQAK